mgnify:CR=1 FL=1
MSKNFYVISGVIHRLKFCIRFLGFVPAERLQSLLHSLFRASLSSSEGPIAITMFIIIIMNLKRPSLPYTACYLNPIFVDCVTNFCSPLNILNLFGIEFSCEPFYFHKPNYLHQYFEEKSG